MMDSKLYNALFEDAGALKGLPPAWLKMLTDMHHGAGKDSEVVKLGNVKILATQDRSLPLSKMITSAMKAGAPVPATGETPESEKNKQPIGFYFSNMKGEPVMFTEVDTYNSKTHPFKIIATSGETLTRLTRGGRYNHDEEVTKMNLGHLTTLLPPEELQVYAVYSDKIRAEKRLKRSSQKAERPSDIDVIKSEAEKRYLKTLAPKIGDAITRVGAKVDNHLRDIHKKFTKAIESGNVNSEFISDLRMNIQQASSALDRLDSVARYLEELTQEGKVLRNPEHDYNYNKEKGGMQPTSDYVQFMEYLSQI